MAARRTLHNYRKHWGDSEVIRCPGCGKTEDLVFLEIRNWETEDVFKVAHVVAVCQAARRSLFWRFDRDMVFGVSALVNLIPWTCQKRPEIKQHQPSKARTNPKSLANLDNKKRWAATKVGQKPQN